MSIINKIIRLFAAYLIISLLFCGCTQSYNASNHLSQSQIRVIPEQSIKSHPEQKYKPSVTKQIPVNDKYDAPAQLGVPLPPIPDESDNSSKEIRQ